MKKVAVLFAGQGAQYTGMGKEFYDVDEAVKSLYKKASQLLDFDLNEICFEENDYIHQTEFTQPSILVTSISIYQTLLKKTNINPSVLAGFSLGEYSALYASGIFDFEQIVHLIKNRAQYMESCSIKNPGKMAAIIGLDRQILKSICNDVMKTHGLVQIANYNSPNQLVIGGLESAVLNVCKKAKEEGARRAVILNVSGGFHTPLMNEAANKMYETIVKTSYKSPKIDIIMNVTGDYLNIDSLPQLMKKQIESSVYFEDSIHKMIEDGINTFIEIGPGKVLSGFVRKIDRSKKVISINQLSDIEEVKAWI